IELPGPRPHAPTGDGGPEAEAQEAQCRLAEDHAGDGYGGRGDPMRHEPRDQMPGDDTAALCARQLHRADIQPLDPCQPVRAHRLVMGGLRPRPRKLNAVSPRIMPGMDMVAEAIRCDMNPGTRCRAMIRLPFAPISCAART